MRSRMGTVLRKSSDSIFDARRSSMLRRIQSAWSGPAERGARQHDAREPAAAESVLVVHRRLMNEVRELARPGRAAVPEEHEVGPLTTASVA